MKKVLIWILVPILVAVLTVVGTVAYLTATDAENNTMTVGDASIEIVEFERYDGEKKNGEATLRAFAEEGKLLHPSVVLGGGFNYSNPSYEATPTDNYVAWEDTDIRVGGKTDYKTPIWDPDDINNELDKMVFVKNTGKVSVYVRICFAFEAGNYVRYDRFAEMVHLNKNESGWTWDWVEEKENHVTEIDGTRYYIAWATYQNPVAPDEYTEISLSQIALDFAALNDHAKAFGEKYEVLTFAQGVQVDEFKLKDAAAALTNAFGDSIPFENIKHVEFTDLKTALHYLNADTNGLMLKGGDHTKQEPASNVVNRVTFGLTEDHPDVVKNHKGVLVANKESVVDNNGNVTTLEADFTAYTYYVPTSDGKQYDIYVLADNWKIYAPADSYGLFYRMAGLTEVDTSNIDFSYATSLQDMFRDCQSLTELDTSDWDVSSVERMFAMFQNCTKLNNIDVSGWNTTSLSNTQYMFHGCSNLTTLDVSNWDVSNLTKASHMFRYCGALTYLDVSRWKVDNVGGVEQMFDGCKKLQKLDVSDWKLDKVQSFIGMFQDCSSLTSLDVSQWTIDSATDTSTMFNGCSSLTTLDVSNWNTANVTTMESMFSGCSSLASLDVSSFNTAAVTNMKKMFSGCSSLAFLDVSSFNTAAVTTMESMFVNCSKITEIVFGDDWSTAEVDNMRWMFRYCDSLESLDVSGWKVGKVTTMESMFFNCINLKSLDTSMWNPVKLINASLMFNQCDKIKVFDLSGWNPLSLKNIGKMFFDCDNLEKIYVGYKWPISQITSTNSVFRNSPNLEGGNGTKFIVHGEKGNDFARIDGEDGKPGYFTEKK